MMISLSTVEDCLSLFNSCDEFRVSAERNILRSPSISGYCTYCDSTTTFLNNYKPDTWTDMRGQLKCSKCLRNNRERLLLLSIRQFLLGAVIESAVVFEKVTGLYKALAAEIPSIKGVEFLGVDKVKGNCYMWRDLQIEHQDMMDMSFDDESQDLLIHSDVLEHISDYKKALNECYRVLKKGGVMIFACPIFNHIKHVRKGFYNNNGSLEFVGKPSYHGNPLSDSGSPVFFHFGLEILCDLQNCGFDSRLQFEFAPHLGIISNCNPYYDEGHMWPLVVYARKN